MTLRPTDDQLKTLQSVERSIAGIDAVPNKEIGFDCVILGGSNIGPIGERMGD